MFTLAEEEWITKVEVYYGLSEDYIFQFGVWTNLNNKLVLGYVPSSTMDIVWQRELSASSRTLLELREVS